MPVTQAILAAAFVNALGVNAYVNWSGIYSNQDQVALELAYLGAKHIRSPLTSVSQFSTLAADGFDIMALIQGYQEDACAKAGGYAQTAAQVEAAHPGAILYFEGPNELNEPANGVTCNGAAVANAPGAIADMQQSITGTVQGILNKPVVIYSLNPALPNVSTIVSGVGNLSGAAAHGDWHVYPNNGREPRGDIANALGMAQRNVPSKPIVLSEFGYSGAYNDTSGWGGVTEDQRARMSLNGLADAVQMQADQVFFYWLNDQGSCNPSDIQSCFGLFDQNGNPKPVATAFHNLTEILGDQPNAGFTPGALDVTVSGLPSTGYNLLMEKTTGAFDLALWNEQPGVTVPATVTLGTPATDISVYDPIIGTTAVQHTSGATAVVQVPDHVVIVEINGPGQIAVPVADAHPDQAGATAAATQAAINQPAQAAASVSLTPGVATVAASTALPGSPSGPTLQGTSLGSGGTAPRAGSWGSSAVTGATTDGSGSASSGAAASGPVASNLNVGNRGTAAASGSPALFGAYVGQPSDTGFAAQYASLASSVGQTPGAMDTYVDSSLPKEQWASDAQWAAQSWTTDPSLKNTVPIIGLPMADSTQSGDAAFKAIASGQYDSAIEGVLQAWASAGYKTLYLRPGFEMNGNWSNWVVSSSDAADFVAAFQHIASLAHGFQSASVQTVWNPNVGSTAVPLAQIYPGNSAVDVIGLDTYGAPIGGPAPTDTSADPNTITLQSTLAFAKAQGKPFALPETGGTDATFAQQLGQVVSQSGVPVAFVNLWDVNDNSGNLSFSSGNQSATASAWKQALTEIQATGGQTTQAAAPPPAQASGSQSTAQIAQATLFHAPKVTHTATGSRTAAAGRTFTEPTTGRHRTAGEP